MFGRLVLSADLRRSVLLAFAAATLGLGAPLLARAGDDPFAAKPRGASPAARQSEGRCGDPRGVSLFAFPDRPADGGTLRWVAVSETPRDARLVITDDSGARVAATEQRRGGP